MGDYYKNKITCVTSYTLQATRIMPEFVNPIEILNKLELRKSMVAADFGSGSGGWTIPLAKRLEQGLVFAVDIQGEPLSALQGKAKFQKVANIKTIVADVEQEIPGIRASTCDLVLITDLLFQVDNKKAVFQEARRVLKPRGKVLVVEWQPNSSLGPKDNKPSPEAVKQIASEAGFQLGKEFKAGDYHYGLVFVKQ